MPTPSAVTCKLNSRFVADLENPRFYRGSHMMTNEWNNAYNYKIDVLRDKEHKTVAIEFKEPGMQCCGLEELDMAAIQKHWQIYRKDPASLRGLVAHYIRECFKEKDSRVLIVGIPTKVGASSIYDIDYYTQLRETLGELGFVEVGQPYKNVNSGNTIVALVGQLP